MKIFLSTRLICGENIAKFVYLTKTFAADLLLAFISCFLQPEILSGQNDSYFWVKVLFLCISAFSRKKKGIYKDMLRLKPNNFTWTDYPNFSLSRSTLIVITVDVSKVLSLIYGFQLTSLVRSFSNLLLKTYNNNILIAFKELPSSTTILAISSEENYSLYKFTIIW